MIINDRLSFGVQHKGTAIDYLFDSRKNRSISTLSYRKDFNYISNEILFFYSKQPIRFLKLIDLKILLGIKPIIALNCCYYR